MSLGRLVRFSVLLLTFYVTADLMNPSMPGVFFFDDADLFVDGAIEVSASARQVPAVSLHLRPREWTPSADEPVNAADVDATSRPRRLCTHRRWKDPRHRNAVAYPPSPSADPLQPVLS
jgi:hypothetical protein